MAFLDNSGDIILDAVLTDNGRKLLAEANGSFNISKFALGDEEINYSLYNINHASGSAYYDLEILQTPVLESFTNNASSMKTKLIREMTTNNILYLPVMKLNTLQTDTKMHTSGAFMVAVDADTEGQQSSGGSMNANALGYNNGVMVDGIMFGLTFADSNKIRIDSGLDSNEISPSNQTLLIGSMTDTSYIIQIDGRLGYITNDQGTGIAEDYTDDDEIVFYTVDNTGGGAGSIVSQNTNTQPGGAEVIAGPRGSIVQFKIGATQNLQTSTFLFTKLGGIATMENNGGTVSNYRFIDTMVRVTGKTTGYSIDVPVRFIKTI